MTSMATPAMAVGDEKPMLPPSPNGVNAGSDQKSVLEPEDKTQSLESHAQATPDVIHVKMNGHPTEHSTLVNGTSTAATASPPKSPVLSPSSATSALVSESKLLEMESPATADVKVSVESKLTPQQPSPLPTGVSDNAAAGDTAVMGMEVSRAASQVADGSPAVSQPNGAESIRPASSSNGMDVFQQPTAQNAAANISFMAPSLPADQEMEDVPETPVSPSKMARERDGDVNDQPAAKRTKLERDTPETPEFKVPELPGNAGATNRDGTITKMQQKFLLKNIQGLKRVHDSRFFREPVDPVKLNIPNYPNIVTNPMDLGTMEKKLKASEYATVQAVVDDFNLMIQNAVKFNGPEHLVSQEGQNLKAIFDKQMANLPKPDEVEEKKAKKPSPKTQASLREPRSTAGAGARPKASSPQSTTFALGPEGLPLIRRDSTNNDGRPKRSIHPPKRDLPYSTKPKKKKYQWELKFCQEVLDELHKQKHYAYAMPFYYPVDPVALNIPNYHSIIKKPMDLSTMQMKLKAGQYENAKEFEVDLRQIFKNCYKFNIPGDPTFLAGQELERVFNSKWGQKAWWLEANEPHPEHQSVDSSEEESEEEDEESEDDDERLTLLQKQIAEMSRQVEAITQKKKKKTPPSSKKATKSKGLKKEKKGVYVSIGKRDKKSVKSAKPEKQRYVTYHEKQIISNGISSLPDKKMQEALKIIQNNVPSLKGTQETEIELDIDELPNEVLLMLLKFVKKNVPNIADDDDAVAAATGAAAAKPKKNKPMSKSEQEAQISMLQSNLNRFQSGCSPDAMPSTEVNESSDEEDSEESEEE